MMCEVERSDEVPHSGVGLEVIKMKHCRVLRRTPTATVMEQILDRSNEALTRLDGNGSQKPEQCRPRRLPSIF
jgi:hypothetical protein